MISDLTLSLGPLNIPVWLIAVAAAALLMWLLQRTVLRRHQPIWKLGNDILLSGVLTGFLVWKLIPLITRFEAIRSAPIRLLYYPGGSAGFIFGVLAAGGAISLRLFRSTARRQVALAVGITGVAIISLSAPVFFVPSSGAIVDYADLEYLDIRVGQSPGDSRTGEAAPDQNRSAGALPKVVVFWATWCVPCKAQMPEVERFYNEHRDQVEVIALNLTQTESSVSLIRDYANESQYSFPIALDRDGRKTAEAEVHSTPTIVIYDRSSSERARHTGVVNADWIARRVLPLTR